MFPVSHKTNVRSNTPKTIYLWGHERTAELFYRLPLCHDRLFHGARLYVNGAWIRREQIDLQQVSIWDYGLRDGQRIPFRILLSGPAYTSKNLLMSRPTVVDYVDLPRKPTVRRSIRISRNFEQRTGRVSGDRRYRGVY